MRQRIITGIILIIALVPTVIYGGWLFNLVIALLCTIGSMEILRMAKIKRKNAPSIITYVGLLSIVFYQQIAPTIPENLTHAILPLLSIMLLLMSTVIIDGYDFTKAGISTLAMFYLGLGGYAAVQIREVNFALFMFILLVVFTTDMGAYFIGSKIGKRKLVPKISPNKTVEGAIGGIVSALILAAIYLTFFSFTYSYLVMLMIAVVLSITGQFGDLIASRLKRHFEVKDAGSIFPGHGGVLDRFDSVLFTLAMALLLGLV